VIAGHERDRVEFLPELLEQLALDCLSAVQKPARDTVFDSNLGHISEYGRV
jgi:hypothetical protein